MQLEFGIWNKGLQIGIWDLDCAMVIEMKDIVCQSQIKLLIMIIAIRVWDLYLEIRILNWDLEWIEIGHGYLGLQMGIRIDYYDSWDNGRIWDLEIVIWDLRLGLRFGIGDWNFEIGIWDKVLGIGSEIGLQIRDMVWDWIRR